MRVATVICSGGFALLLSVAAQAQTANWQTYAPDNGGFSIQMPDKPTLKDEERNGHPTHSATVGIDKSVAGSDLVFIVKWQPANDKPGPEADGILESVVKAMSDGGKLLSEEKQTLGGYPARQFSFQDADKDTYIVRVAMTDKAFVEAIYLGPTDNALGTKFIASFAVSDK